MKERLFTFVVLSAVLLHGAPAADPVPAFAKGGRVQFHGESQTHGKRGR